MQIPPQPQFGFPTQAPAQPAAAPGNEWLQAAHYTQMTGQLPPGLTPEMIQKAAHDAQQGLSQSQDVQKNLMMQGMYKKFSTTINTTQKMENSVENAAGNLQKMASSIGDLADAGKKDGGKTSSSETKTDTSTTDIDANSLLNKANPMNFQSNMDQHLSHMQGANPMNFQGNLNQHLSHMGGGASSFANHFAQTGYQAPQNTYGHLPAGHVAPMGAAPAMAPPMGAQPTMMPPMGQQIPVY